MNPRVFRQYAIGAAIKKYGFTWPVISAAQSCVDKVSATIFPARVFVASNGKVEGTRLGGHSAEDVPIERWALDLTAESK
jgi:hypothetical protein